MKIVGCIAICLGGLLFLTSLISGTLNVSPAAEPILMGCMSIAIGSLLQMQQRSLDGIRENQARLTALVEMFESDQIGKPIQQRELKDGDSVAKFLDASDSR